MTLKEKWNRSGALRLLAALVVNAAFLAAVLVILTPVYETNDDFMHSEFVGGQYSVSSPYIKYLNFCLALLLKLLYAVGGNGVQWFTVCEYLTMLLGFTAITWVLLSRFDPARGLMLTAVVLAGFACEFYTNLNFTKAAGTAACGGLFLMLFAVSRREAGLPRVPLILGGLLCVLGFAWRYQMLLATGAILAGVGLSLLISSLNCGGRLPVRERLAAVVRFAVPFAVMLAVCAAIFAADALAWRREGYRQYAEFNALREEYCDHTAAVGYEERPEFFDRLGWNADALALYDSWFFYDTEKFNTETLSAILEQGDALAVQPGIGKCLQTLIDQCIPAFYRDMAPAFIAVLSALLLFIACGERGWSGWLGALWLLGSFSLLYMELIHTNRFLMPRVDMCLFLAMYLGFCLLLPPRRLREEKVLPTALLILCLLVGLRQSRFVYGGYSGNYIPDCSKEKAAVSVIMEDDEHLYLAKFFSPRGIYGPFETAPRGFAEKLVTIGGWTCQHPLVTDALARYGVVNPYRDMIDNRQVYIIDPNIDLTLSYVRSYYAPQARAELAEPVSSQTGLDIYRILSR